MRAVPPAPAAEQLVAALATYIDHVESQPQSWRILLRARDDPEVSAVLARVEGASLQLLFEAMGTDGDSAPAPLTMALRAWLAFEKEACSRWLAGRAAAESGGRGADAEDGPNDGQDAVARATLTAVLAGSLLGAMQAVAATDRESGRLLAPLLSGVGSVLPAEGTR